MQIGILGTGRMDGTLGRLWAEKGHKAFNTIYYEHLARPEIDSERISMFTCGDDEDAKATVAQLGRDIGLDVIDSGPLFNARGLEAMGFLWIYLALGVGHGTGIAFRLLQAR